MQIFSSVHTLRNTDEEHTETVSQTELSAADGRGGRGETGGGRESRLCIIEHTLLPLPPNDSVASFA